MKVFSEKDVDSFVAFFTPDATLMFPGSDFIQGEDGICIITYKCQLYIADLKVYFITVFDVA